MYDEEWYPNSQYQLDLIEYHDSYDSSKKVLKFWN